MRGAMLDDDVETFVSSVLLLCAAVQLAPPWLIGTLWLLASVYLAMWVRFTVHEAFHFVAAYMLGMPVIAVDVGRGEATAEFFWRGMHFTLRHPHEFGEGRGGFVSLAWPPRNPLKGAAFMAAGPLSDVVMLAGAAAAGANTAVVVYFAFGLALDLVTKNSDGVKFMEEARLWLKS